MPSITKTMNPKHVAAKKSKDPPADVEPEFCFIRAGLGESSSDLDGVAARAAEMRKPRAE